MKIIDWKTDVQIFLAAFTFMALIAVGFITAPNDLGYIVQATDALPKEISVFLIIFALVYGTFAYFILVFINKAADWLKLRELHLFTQRVEDMARIPLTVLSAGFSNLYFKAKRIESKDKQSKIKAIIANIIAFILLGSVQIRQFDVILVPLAYLSFFSFILSWLWGNIRIMLFVLILLSLSFAFSIENYFSYAEVQENGDLYVYENITFDIPESYSEGFRSIRTEDYGTLDNLVVREVWVNGAEVPFYKTQKGENAEIVWERVVQGRNTVELRYTLKNRVQVYDDFAKICFEHYGANWPVTAGQFHSVMQMPEKTRDTEMHFRVYSLKQGKAYINDLAVVIEMDKVPSGNYIGGCYLYDKAATTSTNIVDGSAYRILENEREAYRSETAAGSDKLLFCCVPILIILFILTAYSYLESRKNRPGPLLPANILPPGDEEPVFVSMLVRTGYNKKDILAATLLGLINQGIVDIVELEKKVGASDRERTILFYKKKTAKLKTHENALIAMLFSKGDEVDLDALAEEYKNISTESEAKKWPVEENLNLFEAELTEILKRRGISELERAYNERLSKVMLVTFILAVPAVLAFAVLFTTLLDMGILSILRIILTLLLVAYNIREYLNPPIPPNMQKEYLHWEAFNRAVKASRLKEYPPASAIIWGQILVYATALGLADKVKHHLSELDILIVKQVEKLERVYASTHVWYGAATRLRNLAKYRRRSGFSSRSSGRWSSRGGGFSRGSSGGGGFR